MSRVAAGLGVVNKAAQNHKSKISDSEEDHPK
ncbi:hypothetical protein COLO4_19886 [Corchorus olitorius]|uniref:Uncharacterized protein n=1 Tax=Corchorus olitorius TaxID=93759 RepID=A0A1R3J2X0_9ROSI|nr:hypothetical protein COLO4_19886 [Corchorus olitorius]